MDLLSYGYKKPRTPDTGEVFWPALEFDIQQLNDHAHNGVNSAPLVATAVVVTTQTILPGVANVNWGGDLGGGYYKQTITLPSVGSPSTQLSFDGIAIEIRDTATGERIYPDLLKNATHTYDIYTNDPSSAWTAIYTT